MEVRLYDGNLVFDSNHEEMELIALLPKVKMYETIQFGGFIEIAGTAYKMSSYNIEKDILTVKEVPKLELNPEETLYESDFICPYCKYVEHDAWELREDDGEYQCGSCGSEMKYERHHEVTYSIEPVKHADYVKL